MMNAELEQVKDAIQACCDSAAEKGVAVEVELEANGFMPGERFKLKVTATPRVETKA